jgi:hypothetical protein
VRVPHWLAPNPAPAPLPSQPHHTWVDHLCCRAAKRCGGIATCVFDALKERRVAHAKGKALATPHSAADNAAAGCLASFKVDHASWRGGGNSLRCICQLSCQLISSQVIAIAISCCRCAVATLVAVGNKELVLLLLHRNAPHLDELCQMRVGAKVAGCPPQCGRCDVGSHKAPAAQHSTKQWVDEVGSAADV